MLLTSFSQSSGIIFLLCGWADRTHWYIWSLLCLEYNLLARSPIQFWNLFAGCLFSSRVEMKFCCRFAFLLLRVLALQAASQIHSGKLKARFVSCCRQVGSEKERKEGRRLGRGEGGRPCSRSGLPAELSLGEQIVPNHPRRVCAGAPHSTADGKTLP